MKKHRIMLFITAVVSVILELLPSGAVCNFATPEKTIRQTFAYFSLTPFGYANFGPFITACLTCIIFVCSISFFIKFSYKLNQIAIIISGISIITSFLPIFLGINYYSVVGSFISATIILQFIILRKLKRSNINETQ